MLKRFWQCKYLWLHPERLLEVETKHSVMNQSGCERGGHNIRAALEVWCFEHTIQPKESESVKTSKDSSEYEPSMITLQGSDAICAKKTKNKEIQEIDRNSS